MNPQFKVIIEVEGEMQLITQQQTWPVTLTTTHSPVTPHTRAPDVLLTLYL